MCTGYASQPYCDVYDKEYDIDKKLVLYIPLLSVKDATVEYITKIFQTLNIGIVNYIYFQDRIDEGKTAIIYLKWNKNIIVENLQYRIKDLHKQARLVHNDPEYWVLLENRNTREVVHQYTAYLKTLNETMEKTISKIEKADKKTQELEKKYENIDWILKLHEAHIKDLYLTSPYDPSAEYKNNSCCGAASNAWIPSYPSIKRDNPSNKTDTDITQTEQSNPNSATGVLDTKNMSTTWH